MNREAAVLTLFLVIPALASSAFGVPETSITRTYFLKDIERASITAGLGMEAELVQDPAYEGDNFFGYLGYAPLQWLEVGLGAHVESLQIYPSAEAKIDLAGVFADSRRLSLLLMGGVGGLPDRLLFAHAGLGLNLRLSRLLQLHLAAGSDTLSKAMSLQAGAFLRPLKSLGVAANAKLVIGQEGITPVLSVAPLVILQTRRTSAASSR
jgi:hypothetical protein